MVGSGGFIGDYAFYYYWDNGARVTATGAGQQKRVRCHDYKTARFRKSEPTDLGKEYIPSLKKWTSNRASGLAVLEGNDFEYESYADNGSNADPIAYRTDDMKGWFINFHTSCCGTVIPPNDQIATEYAELISNRFATAKAVDSTGKLSVVWGKIKKSVQ